MSTQPKTTLTELQRQVILTLAKGATVKDAADAAGLHRTTIYNWIKNSQEFDDAFGAAQALHLAELSDRMEELTTISISTLREILQDPKAPPAVRLRAALAVLKANFFPDPNFNRKSLGPHMVTRVSDSPSDPPEIIEKIEKAQEASATAPVNPVETVETVEIVENVDLAKQTQFAKQTQITPRNALCPCGSGQKFKRCCGRTAPAVLSPENGNPASRARHVA
jgi:AcrR family transcriptional regulator